MGDKVLCQALPDLLRKTILTFCEGSVKFERKLEVIGSVHVRSDSEKVVTFLLDEQVYRYNNGTKKETEEKCEPEDYSLKRRNEDDTKTRDEQRFVVPKKRKLQRPMRNTCYRYSQSSVGDNSDDESEVDFRTSNGERVSRDGIVFSPPRMIRRLLDYTDNTDSNASLSSDETYRVENHRPDESAYGENNSHIQDRYRVELGADIGQFNDNDDIHINMNENPDNNDDAVFERRSRSTMLLTSNFHNIMPEQEQREGEQTERCTSTEVTSTKPDEILVDTNDTAATSPASDNGEHRSSPKQINGQQQNNVENNSKSSPSKSAQFDHVTTSASIDTLLPKLAETTTTPQSSDVLRLADTNMNYQAAPTSILQTQFSLAQSLAYPYMSLPFLQYSIPQTLMALTPPANSTPSATMQTATTVQSQTSTAASKGQSVQNSPTNQQGQQVQAAPSNSDSWDRAVACRECGKMLKSERMLELHMNTAHTHKTVYPCKQCGKIFYAASSLHSHKKRTHTSLENKFKCPHCVRFYAFQSELLRHIDTAHMPISRSTTSTNSSAQFGSQRTLLNYNSTTASPVVIQPKLQSPTSSQTEAVKQELDQNTAVNNHVNEDKEDTTSPDTSPDSEYRFKCQQCGQMLKSRECLNLHINAKHTQKHAYPCSYCDKVFYAPSSRFCHVRRVHASKEQKFCCDYCDKVCTFHYELRNHIKLSHKDKAVPELALPDSATPTNVPEEIEGKNENTEHG